MAHSQDTETSQYTAAAEYQGSPLLLRVSIPSSPSKFFATFPKLAVIELPLTSVSADGLPTPEYNASLEDMDIDTQDIIEASGYGKVFLVETFSGTRTFYVAVSSAEEIADAIGLILSKYEMHNLSAGMTGTDASSFYQSYCTDFNFPGECK